MIKPSLGKLYHLAKTRAVQHDESYSVVDEPGPDGERYVISTRHHEIESGLIPTSWIVATAEPCGEDVTLSIWLKGVKESAPTYDAPKMIKCHQHTLDLLAEALPYVRLVHDSIGDLFEYPSDLLVGKIEDRLKRYARPVPTERRP